jgi:hypothetical protein
MRTTKQILNLNLKESAILFLNHDDRVTHEAAAKTLLPDVESMCSNEFPFLNHFARVTNRIEKHGNTL